MSDWNVIRGDAFSHPNVEQGREVIPGGPSREWIEDLRTDYGEDSPQYVARVLAQFPTESEHSAFRREWREEATRKHRSWSGPSTDDPPTILALDPARFGPDESVLAVRRGDVLWKFVSWRGRMDTTVLRDLVLEEAERHGVHPRPRRTGKIVVDDVGLGGPIADALKAEGFDVIEFGAGKRAKDPERYFNRRAEAYWGLRQLLEGGKVALPDDDKLWEELTALRWRPTPKGTVQLESKDDLKSRIGRSPDRADSAAMAFDPGGVTIDTRVVQW